MRKFAVILMQIAKSYNCTPTDEFSKVQNEMVIHLMDRCLRVASHLIPPAASTLAFNRAKKYKIDIFRLREKHKNASEKLIKQSNPLDTERFILEHYYPVNLIVKDILSDKNRTISTFEKAVGKLKVVWVLKSEDERLNKNGHKVNRPNPPEAYRKARITTNENPYKGEWLKKTSTQHQL